jgi:hypothetical protein
MLAKIADTRRASAAGKKKSPMEKPVAKQNKNKTAAHAQMATRILILDRIKAVNAAITGNTTQTTTAAPLASTNVAQDSRTVDGPPGSLVDVLIPR